MENVQEVSKFSAIDKALAAAKARKAARSSALNANCGAGLSAAGASATQPRVHWAAASSASGWRRARIWNFCFWATVGAMSVHVARR